MLKIEDLCKNFTKEKEEFSVLNKVSLTLSEGEFFVLLGRSGCGKTTLLRCIGGFEHPDSGTITLDGRPVLEPSRDRMMIFQNFDQLFPWLSLKKNISYAMKKVFPAVSKEEREQTAMKYLEAAGLFGFENQYPASLSGGMKQRGALARALALKPSVLLMDEPFSSLDYLSRESARDTVKKLAKETGCTVFLVTHDIEEAVILGTRIGILDYRTHRITKIYNTDDYKEHGHLTQELKKELF